MRNGTHQDRIIFNGHDLSGLVMCRIGRSIMPPVEISASTVGGRHGELFRRSRLTGYNVPVMMWLRTEDRREVAELRHQLAAALFTEEPAPLYLPDDPTRYLMAIVSDETDLGDIVNGINGATVTFHVCDPIAYGNRRTATLTGEAQKSINAGGTWDSKPVITSTAVGGTWRIANVTSGEYVEIDGTVKVGSAIVCDMEKERLTVDGVDVAVTIESDFFGIGGRCTLRAYGASSTTVDWRERWL